MLDGLLISVICVVLFVLSFVNRKLKMLMLGMILLGYGFWNMLIFFDCCV